MSYAQETVAERFIDSLQDPNRLTFWLKQFNKWFPGDVQKNVYENVSEAFESEYAIFLKYIDEDDTEEIEVLFCLYLEDQLKEGEHYDRLF